MQEKNKQSTGKSNIHRRITAREVQERLKNNPGSFTDSDIVEAIKKLQDLCVRGTVEQSRKAREILSTLLIPKGPNVRKTDNENLAKWKKFPFSLVLRINHFETVMRPEWDKGKTKRERREKAFKRLCGRYPTEEEYKELTKEGNTIRDRNFGDFVLSCFAFFQKIPFARFKDWYHKDKMKKERDWFLQYLKDKPDQIYATNQKLQIERISDGVCRLKVVGKDTPKRPFMKIFHEK